MNYAERTVLHADREHSGIRALVLGVMVVSFALVFLISSRILRNYGSELVASYAFVLSCLISVPIGLGLAAIAEYGSKRLWPSGRRISFLNDGLHVVLDSQSNLNIDWSKRYGLLKWYFSLRGFPRGGRERRIPASWYCFAYQIQQDEHKFVVYSYLSGKEAEDLNAEENFFEIKPADFNEKNPLRRRFTAPDRPTIPTSVLASKEGRFWLAEKRRWEKGLELDRPDFLLLLEQVNRHYQE